MRKGPQCVAQIESPWPAMQGVLVHESTLTNFRILVYCMAFHSAGSHAAPLNGHHEEYQLSDPQAPGRCLTSIGNTDRSLQDAEGGGSIMMIYFWVETADNMRLFPRRRHCTDIMQPPAGI